MSVSVMYSLIAGTRSSSSCTIAPVSTRRRGYAASVQAFCRVLYIAVLACGFCASSIAAPIPIDNPSFEQPSTASEQWYDTDDMPGWGYWDRYGIGGSTRCVVNASHLSRLPSGAPHGRQVGAAREGFFRQILYGSTVEANKTYTLSAFLGIDNVFPTQGLIPRGTKFGLWAVTWSPTYAEAELVTQIYPEDTWAYGTMSPVTMSVDVPDNTPYEGWTLVIGVDQTSPNSIVEIDDVKLDAVTTNDWVGNQIGVTDDNWVPQPWTSLQLTSSDPVQVECWGRSYTFGAAGVISVTSQGSELLASPSDWEVYVYKNAADQNHRVIWTPQPANVTAQAAGAIEFTASSLGDVFGLRLVCSGRIEFDGFVKLDFSLQCDSPVTVKKIIADVPFKSAYAGLMHHFPMIPVWYGGVTIENINSGSVPQAGWNSAFLPHMWLGNEEKGMQWLCESDKNWKPADSNSAVQIIPDGDTTTLRLNLVGRTVALSPSAPRQYTFGFEASPVKPVAADRYTWHYTHVGGCSDILRDADIMRSRAVNAVSTHSWTEWLGYPLISIPRNATVLQWATSAAHERSMDMMVLQAFLMSDACPEYAGFFDECKIVDAHAYSCPGYLNDTVYAVCQKSIWSDFMIKGIDKTIRDFGLDGIYSDSMTCIGTCTNQAHGCGYMGDDGDIRPTIEIFAARDFTKRLYRVLEQQGTARGKPMKFVGHTSANIMLPALGFCDAYLDTEHLTIMERPFRIPDDVFRAEFMGRNFGIPAQTLSYYGVTNKGLTAQEMLAISLLHDTEQPWAYDVMSPVWKAWDSFGMSHVHFLGYWQPWGWQAPEGVRVSAYSKPEMMDMLIVAANLGLQPIQGSISVPADVVSATDVFTGTAATIQNGAIADTFPVMQARMYRVGLSGSTIRGAINAQPGAAASFTGIVSAAFDGFFYVQAADRTAGMRVTKPDHGMQAGRRAAVSGYVGVLDSGEKHLIAGSAAAAGAETIRPLAMTNKTLGGGEAGQPGIWNALGLNNIGLLVKTSGKVMDITGQPSSFLIDDGSGVGVTVAGTLPTGAQYVTIEGISSCTAAGGVNERLVLATKVLPVQQVP